jgi:hypothetical protein
MLTRYPLLVKAGSVAAISVIIGGVCATVGRNGLHWDQETALFPWLMRNGWVLYRDLRDQHGPLFPALLSLLPDAGSAGTQFLITIVSVSLIAALVAVAAWRTAGPVAAMFATGLYALWLLPFEGEHLWYDLGLAPFYLGAYLLGWGIVSKPPMIWRPIALGLLLGCAVLLKQQAVIALLGGLALIPVRPLRSLALYLGAASVPVIISLAAFAGVGALGDYVYWAGIYNLSPFYVQAGSSPVPVGEWPALLALCAPVLALALSASRLWSRWRSLWRFAFFTGVLLLAGLISIWPRYARFHLAAALPLLAVVGGVAIWNLVRYFPGFRTPALAAWGCGVLLMLFALRVTGPPGVRAMAAIWRTQPAPLPYSTTAGSLRAWVQASTPVDQPILVYDLDPTLYRVVERHPPKPWSPLFPWILEGDSTIDQWLGGIEAERPRIALVTPEFVAGRHLPLPDGGRSEAFLRANYGPGPHFKVQKYPTSGQQEIVALQLSGP